MFDVYKPFLTTDNILCRRSQERQRGEAAVFVD